MRSDFRFPNFRRRQAFTLTELLIVILIVGVMTGLALSALSGATELAREQRTRSVIAKLHQLIRDKYEGYRTRPIPIKIPRQLGTQPTTPRNAAYIRLCALRDLMRMEMPDRVTDVIDNPVNLGAPWNTPLGLAQPSELKSYRRLAQRSAIAKFGPTADWTTTWTSQHQGSECLYLIVSLIHDGDKSALDYFSPDEIGDVDDDGMKEILDGWGKPIEFLRWAPGYLATRPPGDTTPIVSTPQDFDFVTHPDQFDPLKADPRWGNTTATIKPYMLTPLILSAGRDRVYDIAILSQFSQSNSAKFRYSATASANTPVCDPYWGLNTPGQLLNGPPFDNDADGISSDNITNHFQETP